MTAAPSRELLCSLGEDLGLSPTWRAQAVRATAEVERRFLLVQVARRLLVATPAARARLRAWLDRQRAAPAAPMSPQCLARWIRDEVLFFGDLSMLTPVVEALVHVPPPVRAAALAECLFLAVGAETRAWTGASRLVDRDDETRPRMILLSGADRHVADLTRTAVHEIAHAWLLPRPFALATAWGELNLRAVVAESGGLALTQSDANYARDERLADACSYAWLGAAGAR